MDTVAGTALDMFVHHGLPLMGKKAVEMGRYNIIVQRRSETLNYRKKLSITLWIN